jgi:hypothetical protein
MSSLEQTSTMVAGKQEHDPTQVALALRQLPPQAQAAAVADMKKQFADDPEEVAVQAPASTIRIPALPDGILSDALSDAGAGQWVDDYVRYALAKSPMTPVAFHESAALSLASIAIARRLKVPMAFGDVYPNLFVIWLAPTTLWNKSTALDIARRQARRVFPHLLAAQDSTIESLHSDMAGYEPINLDKLPPDARDMWARERNYAAQRGQILDEMSGLLAGAGRDYNAGMVEALLRMYDCDALYTRSTRGQGRVVIKDAYLNILGASTPAAMTPHLSAEKSWSNGWWPRFAILTPETDRPAWKLATAEPEPPSISTKLHGLYDRLPPAIWPDAPSAVTVSIEPDASQAWHKYNKVIRYDFVGPGLDPHLSGTYGRLPVQALKVGTILSALDWPEDQEAPRIKPAHMARALTIVESWRVSAHRCVSDVRAGSFDRLLQRVQGIMTKYQPAGVTLRELRNDMRDVEPEGLERVLGQMVRLGLAEEVSSGSGLQGGRPTARYVLCR